MSQRTHIVRHSGNSRRAPGARRAGHTVAASCSWRRPMAWFIPMVASGLASATAATGAFIWKKKSEMDDQIAKASAEAEKKAAEAAARLTPSHGLFDFKGARRTGQRVRSPLAMMRVSRAWLRDHPTHHPSPPTTAHHHQSPLPTTTHHHRSPLPTTASPYSTIHNLQSI